MTDRLENLKEFKKKQKKNRERENGLRLEECHGICTEFAKGLILLRQFVQPVTLSGRMILSPERGPGLGVPGRTRFPQLLTLTASKLTLAQQVDDSTYVFFRGQKTIPLYLVALTQLGATAL